MIRSEDRYDEFKGDGETFIFQCTFTCAFESQVVISLSTNVQGMRRIVSPEKYKLSYFNNGVRIRYPLSGDIMPEGVDMRVYRVLDKMDELTEEASDG